MTRMEIASALEQIVAGVLSEHEGFGDNGVITRQAKLHDDLGMDEADIFEVMLRAENRFGVSLPDNDIGIASTLTDIADLVAKLLSEKAQAQAIAPSPVLASPPLAPQV